MQLWHFSKCTQIAGNQHKIKLSVPPKLLRTKERVNWVLLEWLILLSFVRVSFGGERFPHKIRLVHETRVGHCRDRCFWTARETTDMAAHHKASSNPPATKKGKIEDKRALNGSSSYIPTERESSPQFSVVFSMKEEKGALVKALELCKVRYQPKIPPHRLLYIQ